MSKWTQPLPGAHYDRELRKLQQLNINIINPQTMEKSVFQTLNSVNCNEHTEKKNGLTYLSWAWAWAEVKKAFPSATYAIYENADGWNYHTDGRTCWVKTGVTIDGLENIEYLPVMDFKNASIPAERVTSFDVNKAIQRSLTKACARHGLGLYIYAGEDLPEETIDEAAAPAPAKKTAKKAATKTEAAPAPEYTFPDEDTYWKAVRCAGQGLVTKAGKPIREWLLATYNVPADFVTKFDADVTAYISANC